MHPCNNIHLFAYIRLAPKIIFIWSQRTDLSFVEVENENDCIGETPGRNTAYFLVSKYCKEPPSCRTAEMQSGRARKEEDTERKKERKRT